LHQEATNWICGAAINYRESGRFEFLSSLALDDASKWLSWSSWLSYWRHNLKGRAFPALVEYQATDLVLRFYQAVISLFVSREVLFRMIQNPIYRALAMASVPPSLAFGSKDLLLLGADMWAVTMWSNLLFFCANITVRQGLLFYSFHNRRLRTGNQATPMATSTTATTNGQNINVENADVRPSSSRSSEEDVESVIAAASWKLVYTKSRRYFLSAIGAGVGSMIWPGWGTLIGMGVGDSYGQFLPVPKRPRLPSTLLRSLLDVLQQQKLPDLESNSSPNTRLASESDMPHNDTPKNDRKKLYDIEARMCGCCQIVAFSANPNSHDRAPISSRTCGHSICRSCVTKCHVMLMERRCTYVEWIKCPLCNAQDAFSSYKHVVNRSLCEVLEWMDGEA
jgi:hypothetical protein